MSTTFELDEELKAVMKENEESVEALENELANYEKKSTTGEISEQDVENLFSAIRKTVKASNTQHRMVQERLHNN